MLGSNPYGTRNEESALQPGRPLRYRRPSDVVLFLEALALSRAAQQVKTVSLNRLIPQMASMRLPLRTREPIAAARAAQRAGARAAHRPGWLDTCLTRTLVAAALLKTREPLTVHLGFRPGNGSLVVDGHAWLVAGETRLDLTTPLQRAGAPYQSVVQIPWPPEQTTP